MTTPINEMSPRELDVALAEKLFGLRVTVGDGFPPVISPDGSYAYNLPHYSTTAVGMLVTLERLLERGWQTTINAVPNVAGSLFFVRIGRPSPLANTHNFSAEILPLAVARAALAALGAK